MFVVASKDLKWVINEHDYALLTITMLMNINLHNFHVIVSDFQLQIYYDNSSNCAHRVQRIVFARLAVVSRFQNA